MASQTARDVLTLPRQPMQFLSLSPTTSASYPITPVIKSPTSTSPTTAEINERRRSSSASSASANGNGRRFLKLGPVHFGESYDSDGDWSEDVVAE